MARTWEWTSQPPTLAVDRAELIRRDDFSRELLRQLDTTLRCLDELPVTNWARTGVVMSGPRSAAVASYLTMLLFHDALHEEVEAALDHHIRRVARSFAHHTDPRAELLQDEGIAAVRQSPRLLLRDDINQIRPLGVSGGLVAELNGACYALVSARSARVAVNPGVVSFAAEGGVDAPSDSTLDVDHRLLTAEWQDELQGLAALLADAVWVADGWFLPLEVGTLPSGRSGPNLVWRCTLGISPEELLRNADQEQHFEARRHLLVPLGSERSAGRERSGDGLRARRGIEMSEGLRAWLTDCVSPALSPDGEVVLLELSDHGLRNWTPTETIHVQEVRQRMATIREQSLEDQFAQDQLQRHPILHGLITAKEVKDLGERKAPAAEGVSAVVSIATLLHLSQDLSQATGSSDGARLFEAVVYALSRELFLNDEDTAQSYMEEMRSTDVADVGSDQALTARIATTSGKPVDPGSLLNQRLTAWQQSEELAGYTGIRKFAELLCFCSAVWCMELKRSPAAADFALREKHGGQVTGDAIGLFFKARALLVSPVSSVAQNQLGLQFVSSALLRFERNAGMHHTKALYLLRMASSAADEERSGWSILQARESVEDALRYDPEFATFYATRARIRFKQGDRLGAQVDLQSAIELARYGADSESIRADQTRWADLLGDWELL